jgi:hypothetical protein
VIKNIEKAIPIVSKIFLALIKYCLDRNNGKIGFLPKHKYNRNEYNIDSGISPIKNLDLITQYLLTVFSGKTCVMKLDGVKQAES